jgi:hypothetical protein
MINLDHGYDPKDQYEDEHDVVCETHGVKTTWGKLDPYQRFAFLGGLDTASDLPCMLLKGDV